jgi:hypothetical protein
MTSGECQRETAGIRRSRGATMPYSIVNRRNQYCVIKDDDGRVMGCHPTREQAQAQLTALNIAERRYRLEVLP